MFEQYRKFETMLAGRPLTVETGKMAQLAGGSCMISYGETQVLCNATMSDKPRDGIDFFPLSVDLRRSFMPRAKSPALSSAVRAARARRRS